MAFRQFVVLMALAQFAGGPRTATFEDGAYFTVEPGIPVVVTEEEAPALRAAIEALGAAAGVSLRIVSASQAPPDPAIYIGTASRHPLLQERRLRRWVDDLRAPGRQGYRMVVRNRFVLVAGEDLDGTVYGARRLVSLVEAGGRVPVGKLRDAPHAALRAAALPAIPTSEQVAFWAQARVNVLAAPIEALTADASAPAAWDAFADRARQARIAPALRVDLAATTATVSEAAPEAAEPVRQADAIALPSDDWRLLSRRNVVDTDAHPIRVRRRGAIYQRDRDFVVLPGRTAPPYPEDAAPWMIRRVPGGAIPDGAEVEVIYDYLPPLAPHVATAAALGGAGTLPDAALLERFAVDWLIVDGAEERLEDVARLAVNWPGTVILTVGMDLVAPAANAWPRQGRARLVAAVPADEARAPGVVERTAKATGVPIAVAGGPAGTDVYLAAQALGAIEGAVGILARGDDAEAMRRALHRAWAPEAESLPWPEGLNAVFEADLWTPDYAEMQSAMVRHINRRTLAGVPPDAALASVRSKLEPLRRTLNRVAVDEAEAVYAQLAGWLQLEAAYDGEPSRSVIQELIRLANRQAELDPRFEADRLERITEIVETQGLFVPSSILFREFVLPYRPMRLPAGARLLEAPAQITYHDAEHEATAEIDFLAAPGPVTRVDFDTVGTARCRVMHSVDGQRYVSAEERTSSAVGGLRGPMILREPVMSRFLRVTVEAPAGRAVLRDVRVSALKQPTRVTAARTQEPPTLDADFKEPFWPREAPIVGFVAVDADRFAHPQSTVRVAAGRDALYIAAYLRETRMETKVTSGRVGDSELWEDESFAVRLRPPGGAAFRFMVTADGVRLDGRDGDVGWDAHWEAVVKDYPGGWAAEMALPYAALGASPRPGETWEADFVRYRRNVTDEISSWTGRRASDPPSGAVAFE